MVPLVLTRVLDKMLVRTQVLMPEPMQALMLEPMPVLTLEPMREPMPVQMRMRVRVASAIF